MPLPTTNDPVGFLVSRKFPNLAVARVGNFPSLSRSFRSQPSTADNQQIVADAAAYAEELRKLTPEELATRYAAEQSALQSEWSARFEAEEKARPFNQPWAKADFSHWATMSYWTPEEAVALALECSPPIATWKTVEPLVARSTFAQAFASKRDVVRRAVEMGQLWEKTIPWIFVKWAGRMKFALPDNLVDAVNETGEQIADWKSLYEARGNVLVDVRAQLDESRKARLQDFEDRKMHLEKTIAGYTDILAKRDEDVFGSSKRTFELF